MTDPLTIERIITAEEIRRTLLSVATDKPNVRNPSLIWLDWDDVEEVEHTEGAAECVYTYPSGRHCVAGETLARLLGEHLVPKWGDDLNTDTNIDKLVRDYYQPIGIRFENAAVELLAVAQTTADSGAIWFDAVAEADELERD